VSSIATATAASDCTSRRTTRRARIAETCSVDRRAWEEATGRGGNSRSVTAVPPPSSRTRSRSETAHPREIVGASANASVVKEHGREPRLHAQGVRPSTHGQGGQPHSARRESQTARCRGCLGFRLPWL
jgi:hypothetical protein